MVSLDALEITENLKLGLLQPYWPARHRHRKRLRFQQTPRHTRRIIERHGQLLDAETGFIPLLDEEKPHVAERVIRFRTVGDATCTGAVASTAATLDEIIAEVAAARQTERGTRADDKRSETAMEDRKKEGYF